MQYVWFIWSSVFLLLWVATYFLANVALRKEMLQVSLWTMTMGLYEPLRWTILTVPLRTTLSIASVR